MKVVRPIDLKFSGEPMLESEKAPQLLKQATFYVSEKTSEMSDEAFINWVKGKRDNGILEREINELKDDVWRGEFGYLAKTVDRLPTYIFDVVESLVIANNLVKKQENKAVEKSNSYEKWL